MRTTYEILRAAKEGGEVTLDELKCALLVFEGLEHLSGMVIHRLLGKSEVLERYERLKRALDEDPLEWLGVARDPRDPAVQDMQKRLRGAVDA